MSFEYGSESLDIKNPFKPEGAMFAVGGLIISVLGGILLFSVRELVASGEKPEAWGHMIIGVFLLLWGFTAIGRGLFKMFRFFVGRGVPAGLCKNFAQAGNPGEKEHVAYDSALIEQMLMGRKNMTFPEPRGWVASLIYTIFPKLLYMPYPIRNITQRILIGLLFTLLSCMLYGLALFSGSTGLVTFSEIPAADWFGAGLTAAVLVIWLNQCSPWKSPMMNAVEPGNARGLVFMVAAAIMLPFGLDWLHTLWPLPEMPIGYIKWMVIIVGLACITVAVGIGLALLRIKAARPLTEVSEYKEHWQENLHPMDIFRSFSTVMTDYRYKEIPNRVYREFDPKLMIQGSEDKGDFKGDIIQETQPVFIEKNTSGVYDMLILAAGIIAHVLFVLSAVFLFRAADGPAFITPNHIADIVLPPLIFWIFAATLQETAHVYWAEMHFKSNLVHFFTEGTYTESRLSTGMSIYDSTRSENPIVRSSQIGRASCRERV
jgi:hypothetical protein